MGDTLMTNSQSNATSTITPDSILVPEYDSEISKEIDGYIKNLRANHFIDKRGIWMPRGQDHNAYIRCSEKMIDWSADKLKAILSTLKANGCEIEFKYVQVHGYQNLTQKILVKFERAWEQLRIDETTTRRERPLTASERKEKQRMDETGGWFYYEDQWIYTPTGKPKLVVGYYYRRTIGDDIRPLVSTIINELIENNNSRIRGEIEERHKKARLLMRIRKFRHTLWEERQFEAIEKEAKKWARAQKLRAYIAHVTEAAGDHDVSEWIKVAGQLVSALDPLSSKSFATVVNLPKYSDVKDKWQQRRRQHY